MRVHALLLCAAALTVTGCAQRTTWVKVTDGPQELAKDRAECEFEAAKATASGATGNLKSGLAAGVDQGIAEARVVRTCMATKGWQLRSM